MKRNRVFCIAVIFSSLLFLTGASEWEGAGALAGPGELPDSGLYVATNAFPRNTVIDVKNLENDQSVRVIVAAGLNAPGLLIALSREAASKLQLSSREIGRFRVSMPHDPVAYARFGEGLNTSEDPDYNPQIALGYMGVEAEIELKEEVAEEFTPVLDPAEVAEDFQEELVVEEEKIEEDIAQPELVELYEIFDLIEEPDSIEDFAWVEEVPLEEESLTEEIEEIAEESPYASSEEFAEFYESPYSEDIHGFYGDDFFDDVSLHGEYLVEEDPIEEDFAETYDSLFREEGNGVYIGEEPELFEKEEDFAEDELIEEGPEYIVVTENELDRNGIVADEEPEDPDLRMLALEQQSLSMDRAEARPPEGGPIGELPRDRELASLKELPEEALSEIPEIREDALFVENLPPVKEADLEPLPSLDPSRELASLPEYRETETIVEVNAETPVSPEVKEEKVIPPVYVSTYTPEKPKVSSSTLSSGKYYLQISSFSKMEILEMEAAKHEKYPLFIEKYEQGEKAVYRLLIGPLNQGEGGALLEHFKRIGYRDAFIRKGS